MEKRQYGEIVEWLAPQMENLKHTGAAYIKGYELKSCPSTKKDIFDFWFVSLLEVVEYLKEHKFEFNLYLIASSISLKEKSASSISFDNFLVKYIRGKTHNIPNSKSF